MAERRLSPRYGPERLAKLLSPVFEEAGYEVNLEMLLKVVPLLQQRIKTLNDAIPMGGLLLRGDVHPPPPETI